MVIEAAVRAFLAERLPVPVFCEASDEPSYVLIERTGSEERNRVRAATLAIQSYAGSLLGAAELNEQVRTAMESLPELPGVGGCRLLNDYNWTDTATRRYRYQAVFRVTHYEFD